MLAQSQYILTSGTRIQVDMRAPRAIGSVKALKGLHWGWGHGAGQSLSGPVLCTFLLASWKKCPCLRTTLLREP